MLSPVAEKQSSRALTAVLVGITTLAASELAFCAYLGFRFHATMPAFAVGFLLVGAVGTTVSWFRFLEAYRVTNKSLSVIATLFITVGVMIEAMGYLLKG